MHLWKLFAKTDNVKGVVFADPFDDILQAVDPDSRGKGDTVSFTVTIPVGKCSVTQCLTCCPEGDERFRLPFGLCFFPELFFYRLHVLLLYRPDGLNR